MPVSQLDLLRELADIGDADAKAELEQYTTAQARLDLARMPQQPTGPVMGALIDARRGQAGLAPLGAAEQEAVMADEARRRGVLGAAASGVAGTVAPLATLTQGGADWYTQQYAPQESAIQAGYTGGQQAAGEVAGLAAAVAPGVVPLRGAGLGAQIARGVTQGATFQAPMAAAGAADASMRMQPGSDEYAAMITRAVVDPLVMTGATMIPGLQGAVPPRGRLLMSAAKEAPEAIVGGAMKGAVAGTGLEASRALGAGLTEGDQYVGDPDAVAHSAGTFAALDLLMSPLGVAGRRAAAMQAARARPTLPVVAPEAAADVRDVWAAAASDPNTAVPSSLSSSTVLPNIGVLAREYPVFAREAGALARTDPRMLHMLPGLPRGVDELGRPISEADMWMEAADKLHLTEPSGRTLEEARALKLTRMRQDYKGRQGAIPLTREQLEVQSGLQARRAVSEDAAREAAVRSDEVLPGEVVAERDLPADVAERNRIYEAERALRLRMEADAEFEAARRAEMEASAAGMDEILRSPVQPPKPPDIVVPPKPESLIPQPKQAPVTPAEKVSPGAARSSAVAQRAAEMRDEAARKAGYDPQTTEVAKPVFLPEKAEQQLRAVAREGAAKDAADAYFRMVDAIRASGASLKDLVKEGFGSFLPEKNYASATQHLQREGARVGRLNPTELGTYYAEAGTAKRRAAKEYDARLAAEKAGREAEAIASRERKQRDLEDWRVERDQRLAELEAQRRRYAEELKDVQLAESERQRIVAQRDAIQRQIEDAAARPAEPEAEAAPVAPAPPEPPPKFVSQQPSPSRFAAKEAEAPTYTPGGPREEATPAPAAPRPVPAPEAPGAPAKAPETPAAERAPGRPEVRVGGEPKTLKEEGLELERKLAEKRTGTAERRQTGAGVDAQKARLDAQYKAATADVEDALARAKVAEADTAAEAKTVAIQKAGEAVKVAKELVDLAAAKLEAVRGEADPDAIQAARNDVTRAQIDLETAKQSKVDADNIARQAKRDVAQTKLDQTRAAWEATSEKIKEKVKAAFEGLTVARLELGDEPALVFKNGEKAPLVISTAPVNPDSWMNSAITRMAPRDFARLAERLGVKPPDAWLGGKSRTPSAKDIVDGWQGMSPAARKKIMDAATPGLSVRFPSGREGGPFAMLVAREHLLGRTVPDPSRVGAEEAIHILWRGALSPAERDAVLAYAKSQPVYRDKLSAAQADPANRAAREMELGTQVLLDLGAARKREVESGAAIEARKARAAQAAQAARALRGPVGRIIDKLVSRLGELWASLTKAAGVKPDLGLQSRLAPEVYDLVEGIRTGKAGERPFVRDGGKAEEAMATDAPVEDQPEIAREGIAWRRQVDEALKEAGKDIVVDRDKAMERADEIMQGDEWEATLLRQFERGNIPMKDGTELMARVMALQIGQRRMAMESIGAGDAAKAVKAARMMEIEERLGSIGGRILNALRGAAISEAAGVKSLFDARIRQVGSKAWVRKLNAARKASGAAGEAKVAAEWMAKRAEVVKIIKEKTGFDLDNKQLYEDLANDYANGEFMAITFLADAIEQVAKTSVSERAKAWTKRATFGGLMAEVVRGNILGIASMFPQASAAGMFSVEAGVRPLVAKALGRLRQDLPPDVTDAFGGSKEAMRAVADNLLNAARTAIDSSIYGESLGYRRAAGRIGAESTGETAAAEGGRSLIPAGLRHAMGPGAEMTRLMDEFVWNNVFYGKQAHLAARKQRSGDQRPIEEIKGDRDVIDAAVEEADRWTQRGAYKGALENVAEGLGRFRQVQRQGEDGTVRTNWLGLPFFLITPIFKSYAKGLSLGLGYANMPKNAWGVIKALRRANPEMADNLGITVEALEAEQFRAGVESGARLLIGSALLAAGVIYGETESTTKEGELAAFDEGVVRETAAQPGTVAKVPATRLSPWYEATQIGAILREGAKKGGWAGAETALSAAREALVNRPLLSGVPIPRRDPSTGEKPGVAETFGTNAMDLFAVGRPYAAAIRMFTEETARSVPRGADKWVERNYGVDRDPSVSWLGENRPNGGLMRKLIFGGTATPTARETAIASEIVSLNEALAKVNNAAEKPYWFPGVDRVINEKRGWRYNDEEYRAIRTIAGANFQQAYDRLPRGRSPADRMRALRFAWAQSLAQAKSIVTPKAISRQIGNPNPNQSGQL